MRRFKVTFITHETHIQEFDAEDDEALWLEVDSFDWSFADNIYEYEDWDVQELDCS